MDQIHFLTDALVITKTYKSKEEWCNHIHKFVKENKCTYMEAVIDYCESNEIELEHAAKLIDGNIREKIRIEAEQENMMKPIGRLDFATDDL